MNPDPNPVHTIFDPNRSFEDRCRRVFRFQAGNNPLYSRFIHAFGLNSNSAISSKEIPLLPIRAFKHAPVITGKHRPEKVFKSSGTTDMKRSAHHVADLSIYKQAITEEFYRHFPPDQYALLCYMPGYDENPDSSLIWMAAHLIAKDKNGLSGFLNGNRKELEIKFEAIRKRKKKILLFGAAFGLVDLIEQKNLNPVNHLSVLETGGMKTYRREMSKEELRNRLSEGFGIPDSSVHSEYGMCELLSQMYAIGDKWFSAPHWVKVTIRDPDNPMRECPPGTEGKIGIIDLANVHSCSFILTEDRGVMNEKGEFGVLGRWTPDDLRGCNFLIDRD